MKKFLSILLVIVLLSTCVVVFASCGGQEGDKVTFTLIIGENTYTVTTKQTTLHKAVEEMKEKGTITVYDYTGTTFSPFVTAIDAIAPQDAADFVAIYHDIEDAALYMYGSDYAPVTKLVGGKTYYCSGVGMALLPTVEGATYYIFIDTFSGSF